MKNIFQNLFYDKEIANIDVDSEDLTKKHAEIIKKKKLLRSAYETFYKQMSNICDRNFKVEGLEIELGSGVGFFKSVRKNVLTSDIRDGVDCDMSLDATKMNIKNNTVRCFFAINVFHHISYPTKFFEELIRVLKINGGCVLVEPHNGLLSRFIAKNIHKDEYFDTDEINEHDNGNDFEPILEKQSKEISNLLKFMKSLPETIFARLTGSGSCIFAAFESKILAEESLSIFNKRYPLIWSKVVENNFV